MARKEKHPFRVQTAQVGRKGFHLDIELTERWCQQFLPPQGGAVVEPGQFSGVLRPSGTGFVLTGSMRGVLSVPCSRCLADVLCKYDTEVTHYFTTHPEEAEQDGVGVSSIEEETIDCDPVLGEELVLALPSYALCVEGCAGLCSGCGVNLNTESCVCVKEVDPRWDALKKLKL